MLELEGISKKYDDTIVVHPLSLTLRAATTYAIIGPSGCGKSTLLRLMTGLVTSDAGTVRFEGDVLTNTNALAVRQKIGYVIQDGGLFPHLTAEENVTLMAQFLGWAAERRTDRVAQLAELTHFPLDGLQRFPVQLSGGQRQRVSLMRALMLDPHLLVLDEPLGALDPMIRSELQAELKEIFATLGKTVVLVTHDMGEAVFFAETVLLLRDGHVVQQGTPQQLLHEPANEFVTHFVRAQRAVSWEAEAP